MRAFAFRFARRSLPNGLALPHRSYGSAPPGVDKSELVVDFLQAKAESQCSYADIAAALGCTNAHAANISHANAQISAEQVKTLKRLMPEFAKNNSQALDFLMFCPRRGVHPDVLSDPLVLPLSEGLKHNAEAIKAIVNEQLGDGGLSMGDFKVSVKVMKGKRGEDRVVVSLDSRFDPFPGLSAAEEDGDGLHDEIKSDTSDTETSSDTEVTTETKNAPSKAKEIPKTQVATLSLLVYFC
jgi:cyanate lyase